METKTDVKKISELDLMLNDITHGKLIKNYENIFILFYFNLKFIYSLKNFRFNYK